MSYIDWIVLFITIISLVAYGLYKSRGKQNMESYLLAGHSLPWYHVGLSVMATQASAITFLSAPGQAFTDGMRFVQFYFGLPLAMIVLCITFIPIFNRLKVYTAYEFLESRFDVRTRSLTAFLFLIQRSLSTGITIYAPSLILSAILGLNIHLTTWAIGLLVILYTVMGGSKAVSYTQVLQMGIILGGMVLAACTIVYLLPENVGFVDSLRIAGKMGKMNVVDFKFDLNNKYNIWSGIIGGFFLALSYFGTDQSQVGRYLTGSSVAESRLGLLFNGFIKIPMQFFILLIGILVLSFYQFHKAPLLFNPNEHTQIIESQYKAQYFALEEKNEAINLRKNVAVQDLLQHENNPAISSLAIAEIQKAEDDFKGIREEARGLVLKNNPDAETNDINYIFLNFVIHFLPQGLIGLLIAIIFLASMGSMASALNSLASTTVIDIYKRFIKKKDTEKNYVWFSRMVTVFWGLMCIAFAEFATKMGSLIEAVNILGSLFYGTILGIFLLAFYFKSIRARAVFYAAFIAEAIIFIVYYFDGVAFLWLNVLGCALVIFIAYLLQIFHKKEIISA